MTPDNEMDDDEFTNLKNTYISTSFLFSVCRVVEYLDFSQMLFTPVYQQRLRSQRHPKRIYCIKPFWSDLTPGNYLKYWTLSNICLVRLQRLCLRRTKLYGTKDLPRISFCDCLHLLYRSINPQRSSEVGWSNPSISDIWTVEELMLLNVNNIQDIFGMICKVFLWEKHSQLQKYCCGAQNRGLFADIDILAEKQIQYING